MRNSEKDPAALSNPAIPFSRNAMGVAILSGFLIFSLIPIRWWVIQSRQGAGELSQATENEVSAPPEEATPLQPTTEPALEVSPEAPASPTPTMPPPASPIPEEQPTAALTDTPTASPTPRQRRSQTPIATLSPTEEGPTATLMPTATLTPTLRPTSEPTDPTPQLAKVVYVQSDRHAHSLGMVWSNGFSMDVTLPGYAAAPAWSPDGTQLAFFGKSGINSLDSYKDGEGIWIVDAQGRNPTRIVPTDHVTSIAWFPGQKIAYEFAQSGQPHEIVVINPDNGSQIARFPGEQPAWSPKGSKLTIKACLPECGLWQVDPNGSNGNLIVSDDKASYPVWSSQGDLAFTSDRNDDGNWEIYLLRQDSSQLERLTNRPGSDITPAFNKDGSELYFRTDAYGGWWIRAINLANGTERGIKEGVGDSEDWGMARPAVY